MIGTICTPALIYLIFAISQVLIDTVKGFFNTALIKIILTIVFTVILNYLCNVGLGILSWIIVFIPFILMTVIVTLLLFMFNLDPKTGKMVNVNKPDEDIRRDLVLYHEHAGSHDGKSNCEKCKQKNKKKPFYKIKLDGFNTNTGVRSQKYSDFDSKYSGESVNMPHIRDQRLSKYV